MASTPTQRLKHIVENPYLNLVVGLVLTVSGLSETFRELAPGGELRLGAHHGAILFGLVHALRSFSDVFEGLEYLDKN